MSHSVGRTIIDSNSTAIVKAREALTIIGNNNVVKVTGPDAMLAIIGNNNVISGAFRLTSLTITGDNNRNDVTAKHVTCIGSNNRTVGAVVSAYSDSDNDVGSHSCSSDDNYDALISDFSDSSSCESDADYEEAVRRSLADQQKSLEYAHYEPFSVLNGPAAGVARSSTPIGQCLEQSVANLRAIVANSSAGTASVRGVDAERRSRDVVPLCEELERQRREVERRARETERVNTDTAVWMTDAHRRLREADNRRIESERRGREAAIRAIEAERRGREAESRRIESERRVRELVERRGSGRTIDLRTMYDMDHSDRPVLVVSRNLGDHHSAASPLTVARRVDSLVANDAAPSAPPPQQAPIKFAKPANVTAEQDVAVDEKTPESETCNICLANQRKLAFIPCGHRLSCIACTYTVIDKHLASPERDQAHVPCPVCREPCTMVAPVFNC